MPGERPWLDHRVLVVLGAMLLGPVALYLLVDHGILWFVYPDRGRFPLRGMDVSHHQGDIDWEAVEGQDIAFAWIKASEGGDWVDSRFEENWEGALSVGIVPGAYHFFTFCRPPEDQAANLLARLPPPGGPRLPVVADVEVGGNCAELPSPEQLSADLGTFLGLVEQATGTPPLVYASEPFRARYLGPLDLPPERYWIRNIRTEPEGGFLVWQYKSRGRVSGIDGPVDLDVFAGTETDFIELVGGI